MADFDDEDFDDNFNETDSDEEENENISDVDSDDIESDNSNSDNESDNENILVKKKNDDEDVEEDENFDDNDPGKKSSLGNIDDEIQRINDFKRENIQRISKSGIIALLAQNTIYLKGGNRSLNNFNFKYPGMTHESSTIVDILCETHPFIRFINNIKIPFIRENYILALKLVLRPAESNTTIMFTNDFIENFPIFKKNLFNDYILQEELDEIDAFKAKHGLIK